jgi:eukaryotic-like serine/threonine-protein kinase
MSSANDQPAIPSPRASFRECLVASGLVPPADIEAAEVQLRLSPAAATDAERDRRLADLLVSRRRLTPFQAQELLAGRSRFRLGQYTVLDTVGKGGMGHVFKAEHSMMGRVVAVKVLPRSKANPESEAAFQREMRILGRLDHPNLVRAFDAGYDAMVYYLVTELVPGLDLKRQVRLHGPLDEVTAASVFSQAARGLAHAHDQGVVHRDVKPGNILVMDDGRVKLLDMGLAGSTLEEEAVRLGRVVGTMDYIAPEQTQHPDDVGPQADIYGLGCSLYYALSGQVPFPGGTAKEKMKRHRTEPPRPLPEFATHVSEPMCRVVEAMMEKSPERRVARARDVVDLLARWTPERPVPPARSPAHRRGRQPPPVPGDSSAGTPTTSGGWDVFDADRSSDRSGTRSDAEVPAAAAGDFIDRLAPFVRDLWASASSGRRWQAAATALGMLVPAAGVGIGFGWAMSLIRDVAPGLFLTVLGDWTPGAFGRCGFLVAIAAQLLARRGETAAR